MTQTVPATCVLGPGMTGLTIGLRVLNLDGTEYAAFSTTGVAETSVLGTYRKAGGVVAPDAGGYIVWGVSGTDYAEATVEASAASQASVDDLPTNAELATALAGADDTVLAAVAALNNLSSAQAQTAAAAALTAYDPPSKAELDAGFLALAGADGDTLKTLSDQIDAVLEDTADVPTVAEFEARTLLAADYTVVSDLPSVPTASQNADAVLDEAMAGHLAAGSAGAALSAAAIAGDPWIVDLPGDYDAGTAGAIMGGLLAALANVGATVTVVSAVSGGNVTVYANDTWRFAVTDATLALSGYEALALVVKRTARQDDSEAILYLRSDTGLARIDGAAPISAANGTLTKSSTSFTAVVAIAETVGIAAGKYGWWLKGFDATPTPNEGLTLAVGTFTVADPGLQAIA